MLHRTSSLFVHGARAMSTSSKTQKSPPKETYPLFFLIGGVAIGGAGFALWNLKQSLKNRNMDLNFVETMDSMPQ